MLKMSRIVPCCSWKKRASATGSMPGAGMNVPMRYTISAPNRKNRRCRSSAKRVISPRAASEAVLADLVATDSLLDLAALALDGRARTLGDVHALHCHGAGHGAGRDDARPL